MKTAPAHTAKIDVPPIRQSYPILHKRINARDLVYFDNGESSQKPVVVIIDLVDYYSGYNANIHRGILTLAE
jgi:cysteine desulfurase/selenocysteine lyase